MQPARWSLLTLILLCAAPASAAGVKAAIYLEVPSSIRSPLVKAVSQHADLADETTFVAALRNAGLGAGDITSAPAADVVTTLRDAARTVDAGAAVAARLLSARGKAPVLQLVIVAVDSGRVIADERVGLGRGKRGVPSYSRDAQRETQRVLSALTSIAPAAVEPPRVILASNWGDSPVWAAPTNTPIEPVADVTTTAAPSPRVTDDERTFMSLGAALSQSNRRFVFAGRTAAPLRPYSPRLGSPGPSLGLEIYPLTALRDGSILGDLGLEASYEHALRTRSRVAQSDATIDIGASRWYLGTRMRAALGPVELGVVAGYGQSEFSFDGDATLERELPAADYGYVRVGGDVSLRLGDLALLAGGAWRPIVSAGGLGERFFPGAEVTGFDWSAGASLAVADGLHLRALARYAQLRYGSTADNDEGLDQYLTLDAGITYRF